MTWVRATLPPPQSRCDRSGVKQQCYLASLYAQYLVLLAVAVVLFGRGQLGLALIIVGLGAVSVWGYVRVFPSISRFVGYGSVADRPGHAPTTATTLVTIYTAVGCPFCPIVRHRLDDLQRRMGFELREIDVTLRPGLLIEKGIRAVPVVEVGDERLVGHVTTEQLVALITGRTIRTEIRKALPQPV